MTPEQIEELRIDLKCGVNRNRLIETVGGMQHYVSNLKAAEAITQLQEQVTELENHNKDKSQLLANYKEQIKELVKQKYRGEK